MQIKAKHFLYPSNLVSLSRIALIIPLVLLLKSTAPQSDLWILIVLGLAIFSDFLDGKLSRLLNQVSDLGILLDPIADKLIMAVVLAAMVLFRHFPISLVVFLIFRDLIIVIGGLLITRKNKEPTQANFWGKLNTCIISFAAFLYFIPVLYPLCILFILCGYVTILISGISYVRIAEKQFGLKVFPKIFLRGGLILASVLLLSVRYSMPDYKHLRQSNLESNFPEKEILLERFAPIIYFAEKELLFPIAAESFIENSQLMKAGISPLFDTRSAESIDISTFSINNKLMPSYLKPVKPIGKSTVQKYMEIRNTYSETVYAQAFQTIQGTDTTYILQYWFFFWASQGSCTPVTLHQGDWEMVMIQLDKEFDPMRMGFSQHLYGQVLPWIKIEKENNHPMISVAYGSHALYPKAGRFRFYHDNLKRKGLGWDRCKNDIRWNREDYQLVTLDDNIHWLDYQGSWGIPNLTWVPGPKFRHPNNPELNMWQNPLGWLDFYEGL